MIMSTKFLVIGAVSVLGTGVALHVGGRNCLGHQLMSAFHHTNVQTTAAVKAPSPAKKAVEKTAAESVAMK